MNIIIVNVNNDYYQYKYSLLPAILLIHFQIVYFTSYTYTYTTTTTKPHTPTPRPPPLHHH